MKPALLFSVLLLFIQLLTAQNQEKFKFGNVSKNELELNAYEKDTTASAVVLFEECSMYYNYDNVVNDFEIITEYAVRIKVLNNEGLKYADISIPFYKGKTRAMEENISGLTGFTYNLTNGNIEKEKLSKDYIFVEDVTESQKRQKFSMPAVKAGSIIEYKYKLSSPYYFQPENYKFQRDIPVRNSTLTVTIPEYFVFNKETKGFEPIDTKVKSVNATIMIGHNPLQCTAEELTAKVTDLPGLKDEPYVWNYNDYMSGISLELKKIEIVGVYYKTFSQTWGNICQELNESSDFGKQIRSKGIFEKELASIINPEMSDIEKTRSILDMVRSKIKWNDKTALGSENIKKALKEGIGSSADINALLICALKDAGYDAFPVALSLRSKGKLPFTYPSLKDLNYFVVGVSHPNGNVFLDGTSENTDINILPIDCLTDKALCIFPERYDWIDLTAIGRNLEMSNINVQFDETGNLSGSCNQIYSGETAYSFSSNYASYETEDKLIEKIQSNNEISLSEYKMERKRANSYTILETYNFTSNNIRLDGDEIISFNPMIFPDMKENVFKSSSRNLPIEFPYSNQTRLTVNINIPEGYVLDEVPKSEKFVYEEGMADFTYSVKQIENANIILSYHLNINQCTLPVTHYETFRDFWSKLVAKNNELIVLKKKSNL